MVALIAYLQRLGRGPQLRRRADAVGEPLTMFRDFIAATGLGGLPPGRHGDLLRRRSSPCVAHTFLDRGAAAPHATRAARLPLEDGEPPPAPAGARGRIGAMTRPPGRDARARVRRHPGVRQPAAELDHVASSTRSIVVRRRLLAVLPDLRRRPATRRKRYEAEMARAAEAQLAKMARSRSSPTDAAADGRGPGAGRRGAPDLRAVLRRLPRRRTARATSGRTSPTATGSTAASRCRSAHRDQRRAGQGDGRVGAGSSGRRACRRSSPTSSR